MLDVWWEFTSAAGSEHMARVYNANTQVWPAVLRLLPPGVSLRRVEPDDDGNLLQQVLTTAVDLKVWDDVAAEQVLMTALLCDESTFA